MTLLAIPNVSEGRDQAAIDAIAGAFDARLLDVHSDTDHHRSVFTLAGEPGELAQVVANGAAEAIRQVDLERPRGHPPARRRDRRRADRLPRSRRPGRRVRGGARPRRPARRGARTARVPLRRARAGTDPGRAPQRRPGNPREANRLRRAAPDFGPHKLHPTAGAVLVAARPPLVAFNVELAPPATLDDARAIAAAIREGGPEGLHSSARSGCGSRRATWPRCRPTSRTTARRRSRASSRRSPATRRPARRSWSGLRHGRRSTDFRTICRSQTTA